MHVLARHEIRQELILEVSILYYLCLWLCGWQCLPVLHLISTEYHHKCIWCLYACVVLRYLFSLLKRSVLFVGCCTPQRINVDTLLCPTSMYVSFEFGKWVWPWRLRWTSTTEAGLHAGAASSLVGNFCAAGHLRARRLRLRLGSVRWGGSCCHGIEAGRPWDGGHSCWAKFWRLCCWR